MPRPILLSHLPPSWLHPRTLRLAVERRDQAWCRGKLPMEVRREVQATILAVHIALPQPTIEEAVTFVIGWRKFRLALPPAELLTEGTSRSALARFFSSKGIVVGVLSGPTVSAPALAAAAE